MKQLYDIWFAYVMGVNCTNGQRIADSGYGPRLFYNMRHSLAQFNLFTERQIERADTTSIEDVEHINKIHSENNIKSVNYTDGEFPKTFDCPGGTPLFDAGIPG